MGTIIIGSPIAQKGITITPSKIIFNGNNVKKMIKGDVIIWNGDTKPLIPVMTSEISSNGEMIYTSNNSAGISWHIFNSQYYNASREYTNGWYANSSQNERVGYKFNEPVTVIRAELRESIYSGYELYGISSYKIQYSDDGINWTDATNLIDYGEHDSSIS